MRKLQFRKCGLLITGLGLLLSGCMVGPNFHTPKTPTSHFYTDGKPFTKTVRAPSLGQLGGAQQFQIARDLPGEWWQLFHSKKINRLIERGLHNSPNLAAAKANLISAQETLNAQIGSTMLPAISANTTGARQNINNNAIGVEAIRAFNLVNASVNVAYTLDFFGGLRRQIEAVQAQVDFQAFQLEAAYLTLTANIITTAVIIASTKEQIAATEDALREQGSQLKIMNQQFELGGIAKPDLLTQQSLVAQTESTLAPLKQQLARNKHALAVLLGETPSESKKLDFKLSDLNLPKNIPVSLPSAMVRQRPDIRAAEATLHVASANVGVATANLYPQINLSAAYGWQSFTLSELFSTKNNVWNWGGGITAPIFNGESLMARKRAAIANYQNANALYQQTVLQAFQNVADTLRALQHDAENLQALRRAEVAAKQSLNISQSQYKLGGVNYLTVLTSEQQYQLAQVNRISATAARLNDTVALFQALGGGWWNRPCLDCNQDLDQNVARYR